MANGLTDKKPPTTVSKNIQYDLFSTFFGDVPQLSNTIELWDAIPKYSVTLRAQNNLRSPDNRLKAICAQPLEKVKISKR